MAGFFPFSWVSLTIGSNMFGTFVNLYLISNIKFSFVMSVKDELRVINKQKKKSIISDEEYNAKRKAIIDLI